MLYTARWLEGVGGRRRCEWGDENVGAGGGLFAFANMHNRLWRWQGGSVIQSS